MFKYLIFITFLLPFTCIAQFNITGRVLNQADTKPVANASVFLSNATIGGNTAPDGRFTLKNVAPGKYDLVISIIGFETFTQTIIIGSSDINLSDMLIFPKTIALNEVTIKVYHNREKNFSSFYERFKNEFLGTSEFAKDCKIINPDMLDLDYNSDTNTLTATSSGFLEIENDALGYKVKYLLTNFTQNGTSHEIHYDGSVFFTEMKGTPAEERRWQQNRKEAYEGSVMHFLRSALNDRLDEEGFEVLQLARYANPNRPADSIINARIKTFDVKSNAANYNPDSLSYWKKKLTLEKTFRKLFPFPLSKDDIISATTEPGIFALGCDNDELLVLYNKNHRFIDAKQLSDLNNLYYNLSKVSNKELTLLDFKEPNTFFDFNGRTINPNSLSFFGPWSKNRVAELLPVDYGPKQNRPIYADSIVKNLENKISAYAAKHVVEKVHLHLDRPWYGLGDTVWFKGYVVSGHDHRPSALSGVLYAELINGKDSVLNRLTLQLDSGICKGDFAISYKYTPGTYRLRAYTNWMRNDSSYFFDQKIIIGGLAPQTGTVQPGPPQKNANLALAAQSQTAKPDLQFFPEGGYLVNGLRSRVAFKIIGPDGRPKDIQGEITDQDGNEVASFSTQHLGMGQFPLTPEAGKRYKATVVLKDSSKLVYDLPVAQEKGFTLTVNNAGDSVFVKVAANDVLYNSKQDTTFYLMAQSGGKSYYTAKTKLENEVFTTRIEKSRFPSGIIQFTLFSQSGEPLNERVVFIQNPDQLKLKLAAPGQVSSPLNKVKINFEALNSDDKPVEGSFSIAVTDETKVPVDEAAEHTIFTDLLLTSELKGEIENPNYYFAEQNDETRANLDLLMLTQGYRSFGWKKILAPDNSPLLYQPENALSLSGTIKTPGKKPIANGKVQLTSIKDHLVIDTLSGPDGRFIFKNINLGDTTKVIINAKKANGGNNVFITINDPQFPAVGKHAKETNDINENVSPGLLAALGQTYREGQQISLKNVVQLKEVKIQSRRNEFFNPSFSDNIKYSSNLNGPGNANQVLLGDKITACISLAECLQGKLFGVTFKPAGVSGTLVAYSTRALTRHLTGDHPMALFIDGLQRGPEDIDLINPNDVYSIEVLTSVAYLSVYGSNAPDGALIITMKRGSDYKPENIAVDGLITYKFNGYYKAREFYSPKYTSPATAQVNDDRKTIYWAPDIITDKDGKASVEFYNAGSKGVYRVVVEGIDGFGNLGRQVFRYKVE